jgi:hypothetical protein
VNKDAIDSAVRSVENAFSSQVVRIGYSLGEDVMWYPSIFFRVLVRDEAAPVAHLKELSQRLAIALMNAVKTDENGVHAYFDFRSVSEQEKLRDPLWD